MICCEKLLKDLKESKKGSIEEKVCIDIFMNLESVRNDVNFIRAFHGHIIREDVIMILETEILNRKKREITKSIRFTIPSYLKKIKDALFNIKK